MIKMIRNLQKKIRISAPYLITDYRLLITMATLPLAGCMGIYEGGFECPAGSGVGCKSISEVNAMVNQRELPQSSTEDPFEKNEKGEKCATCGHFFSSLHGKPEIWINPFYMKAQKEKSQEKQQEERPEKIRPNQNKANNDTISL